ncbi:MAG TPA: hypothetical protein VGH99_19015 [Pseudonocardia sp.]
MTTVRTGWFEDCAVGERRDLGGYPVTENDLASPFGLAADLLRAVVAVDGWLGGSWTQVRPPRPGEPLRAELTTIRRRRSAGGDTGVVTWHLALRDAGGAVCQEGTASGRLAARGAGPDPVGRDVGTVAWGRALAERLGRRPAFAEALASWDGAVGLRAGEDEVQLRIYRGRVLEAVARTPRGATFTLGADELTWVRLLTAEDNEFMRTAMTGGFTVRGAGYEYLRLTSVLHLVIDVARELALEEAP